MILVQYEGVDFRKSSLDQFHFPYCYGFCYCSGFCRRFDHFFVVSAAKKVGRRKYMYMVSIPSIYIHLFCNIHSLSWRRKLAEQGNSEEMSAHSSAGYVIEPLLRFRLLRSINCSFLFLLLSSAACQ